MTECPFRCGWVDAHARGEEDGRVALCIHLEVEHGADPEPDEEAWELFTARHPDPPPPFRFSSEDDQ